MTGRWTGRLRRHPVRHDVARTVEQRPVSSEILRQHSIPIDFHATRQALADGVVERSGEPLIAIVAMGIHEVQPHLTLSNHGYLGYVFVISSRRFDTLSPERTLLIDTARALTPWKRAGNSSPRGAAARDHPCRRRHHPHPERGRAPPSPRQPPTFPALRGAHRPPTCCRAATNCSQHKYGVPGRHILIGLGRRPLDRPGVWAASRSSAAHNSRSRRSMPLGGVLGKPLKLIARDKRSQPGLGIAKIEALRRHPRCRSRARRHALARDHRRTGQACTASACHCSYPGAPRPRWCSTTSSRITSSVPRQTTIWSPPSSSSTCASASAGRPCWSRTRNGGAACSSACGSTSAQTGLGTGGRGRVQSRRHGLPRRADAVQGQGGRRAPHDRQPPRGALRRAAQMAAQPDPLPIVAHWGDHRYRPVGRQAAMRSPSSISKCSRPQA